MCNCGNMLNWNISKTVVFRAALGRGVTAAFREAKLDKKTQKVADLALSLPYSDRSALLNRLLYVLDRGPEMAVFEAVLSLPEVARWQVVDALFSAVDEPEERRLDRDWEEELQRRVDNITSGRVQGVPWSEVQEKARRILEQQSRPV